RIRFDRGVVHLVSEVEHLAQMAEAHGDDRDGGVHAISLPAVCAIQAPLRVAVFFAVVFLAGARLLADFLAAVFFAGAFLPSSARRPLASRLRCNAATRSTTSASWATGSASGCSGTLPVPLAMASSRTRLSSI